MPNSVYIYILKKTQYYENMSIFIFTKNVANYGGAIYVADETNSGTCGSTSYETNSKPLNAFCRHFLCTANKHT